MSHVRTQIRAAIVARLKVAGIVAPESVLPGRRRPTTQAQLPCLLVYTDEENSSREAANSGVALRKRTVDLVVRCRLSTVADPPQDQLDALAVQVEVALDGSGSLGGLLVDLELQRTEQGAPSPASDRQPGEIDLIYAAEYWTQAGAPETALT